MSWSAPEDWSRWDPDRLMTCPYDEVHRIKAKRFQHHLLKCRQNHPDKDFVNCPFNAKHVMLRHEVRHHVSRCPDRSAIEQYNYKGSEKDKDGFYFKGNTSVPSYHGTEELQQPSESWDDQGLEGDNLQQSQRDRFMSQQESSQTSATVTDILRLSPEEREKFKQQMRREAARRSTNSGMQLPSTMCITSQGFNTNSDVRGQQYSPSSNPVFRHCVEQNAISGPSQQQVYYDPGLPQRGPSATSASKPTNPIFQYCLENMQGGSQGTHEHPVVFEESNEQYQTQRHVVGDRNFVNSRVTSESFSSQETSRTPPSSPTDANIELRSGFIESEMQSRLKLGTAVKPQVAAVSNVCGQPTSPTSTGVNSPHLAGVGRARLHAEARKNNFGGICFSPPKTSGIEATGAPPIGRGRGLLNFAYFAS